MLTGGLALSILVALLTLGVPLAIASAVVGFVGIWWLFGFTPALSTITTVPYLTSSDYALTVIPLFIFMGYIAAASGIIEDLFRTANAWLGRLRGGLAMGSVAGAAAFAAASGSSLASAAVLGRTAIPEMLRHGYDRRLAFGTIAASATIASMIPPSILLVLYAVMVEQPVGKLLIAGILPGLLEAISYMGLIYVIAWLSPALVPPPPAAVVSWPARLRSLKGTWGILTLVTLILGGLYAGVFTPTEAGGIGACGALVIAFARRKLDRHGLHSALLETARATAVVFAIVIGVALLSRLLSLSGFSRQLGAAIAELPLGPYAILAGIVLLYIFLGMFVDALGLMVLTLPVTYPAVVSLGFDPIWFGIIVVRVIEIGLITPPVGMNCYVLKGAFPDVPLGDIFYGVRWFVVVDLLNTVILVAFPQIALFLPSLMN
jgi:tripartite ATP-independent transporter DctM subunit